MGLDIFSVGSMGENFLWDYFEKSLDNLKLNHFLKGKIFDYAKDEQVHCQTFQSNCFWEGITAYGWFSPFFEE
ncbi:MAG: hypothetical protein LBD60_02295 [Puniceicoccales bacterium]|jgi:hypothetical protein|nr:hypothetical protein [Puniceicoccales bacterium]